MRKIGSFVIKTDGSEGRYHGQTVHCGIYENSSPQTNPNFIFVIVL